MTTNNPFLKHKSVLLGRYSTAQTLRLAALSMYCGDRWPFPLHNVAGMDDMHYGVFQEMIDWYRNHGDEDDFLETCEEIKKFEAAEQAGDQATKA